jgi:sulfhydrogenase subunit beta (sulfur reductase)
MDRAPAYVISKPNLSAWVRNLQETATVVAPTAARGADVVYDVVEEPDQVAWGYRSSLTPLKRFLFPQVDLLLRWRVSSGNGFEVEPIYDEVERVFLAARPCDISSVLLLDRVFGRDREDIYYFRRRERTTLIGLNCTDPGENCFCVCAGAGPFLSGGYDLELTEIGRQYLAEVGSEKGAQLIRESEALFAPAAESLLQMRDELAREAERRFGEHKSYFAAALRSVTFDRVPEEVWEGTGERCLECGGCSFVCPTCTCFLTADWVDKQMGERRRLWDSCSYECYALEASGHNPRAKPGHRLKARFFHKLSYQFAQPLEQHGCVGCGRCVTTCMGSDDMPTVTARIRRGAV